MAVPYGALVCTGHHARVDLMLLKPVGGGRPLATPGPVDSSLHGAR